MYKVMIVDDEASIRSGLKSVISWEDLGMEIVCEAENGKDALNKIEAFQPTVVLTDIRMPEMNGYDATRAIRALDRTDAKTIPIIAMSANAFAEDVQEALASGMNAHIAKPIDLKVLEDTLIAILP